MHFIEQIWFQGLMFSKLIKVGHGVHYYMIITILTFHGFVSRLIFEQIWFRLFLLLKLIEIR